jgi:riboflavin kinase/FMN adenylyltransferase
MNVYSSVEEIRPRLDRPLITLGNFDGVHRGHRYLLDRVRSRAREMRRSFLLITFEPHPLKILRPGSAPPLILTPAEKLDLLAGCGVEHALVIPFTREFAGIPAEAFVRETIHLGLGASVVYVGSNFNFGRGREGNVDLLRRMGAELGFEVPVLEDFLVLGSPVSSSRIRRAVSSGEVELARELLGRPFAVSGEVVRGDGRGAALGFPTANLRCEAELIPADGVYVTSASVDGRDHEAVTNVGGRPTFPGASFAIETHLLDGPGPLYGRTLEVRFLGRLRQEVRFESPDQLTRQIAADIARARRFFRERADTADPARPERGKP